MHQFIIPQTYAEWKHCITVICRQPITQPYIEERIKALNSTTDHMTTRFIQLYGQTQHQKTLQWFEQAKREVQIN